MDVRKCIHSGLISLQITKTPVLHQLTLNLTDTCNFHCPSCFTKIYPDEIYQKKKEQ